MLHKPQSPKRSLPEQLMVAIHTKERHSWSDKGEVGSNDDFVARVNTMGTAG